jgi:hypothetical protein
VVEELRLAVAHSGAGPEAPAVVAVGPVDAVLAVVVVVEAVAVVAFALEVGPAEGVRLPPPPRRKATTSDPTITTMAITAATRSCRRRRASGPGRSPISPGTSALERSRGFPFVRPS